MLHVFPAGPGGPHAPHADAVWIDLHDATPAETAAVQAATGLAVPGPETLNEIESSSRLQKRGGALYLSVPALTPGGSHQGEVTPVGFVLSQRTLLTVRFASLPAFEAQVAACLRHTPTDHGSTELFLDLLEEVVDRLADLLEHQGEQLEQASNHIFRVDPRGKRRPARVDRELRAVLRTVGATGALVSKIRDTLLGVGRIVPYAQIHAAEWMTQDQGLRCRTVVQDIVSLNDYDAHLSNKVQFLLDATLGFIGIEQNNIIKVLTIVSVVGVPPTFFASMYGMNFHDIPELSWTYGYPYALALMVCSAVLPLVWFKIRGWL